MRQRDLRVPDRPDRLQRRLCDVVERPEQLRLMRHGLPVGDGLRERGLRVPERDVALRWGVPASGQQPLRLRVGRCELQQPAVHQEPDLLERDMLIPVHNGLVHLQLGHAGAIGLGRTRMPLLQHHRGKRVQRHHMRPDVALDPPSGPPTNPQSGRRPRACRSCVRCRDHARSAVLRTYTSRLPARPSGSGVCR